jgi:hypothetical protein
MKCNVLNKEFETKEEMFKALKANEGNIIALKKASMKNSDPVIFTTLKTEATKGVKDLDPDYVYPVINTNRYMDSHDDVHFDGIWNKTLQEQQGKLYYVLDHSLKVSDVVAWPKDVEASVMDIPWSAVGKDYPGTTQALVYKIPLSALKNDFARKAIEESQPVENSVRMQYVKITMAIDSKESEYKANKQYYDSHVNEIANKERATELGYFFGVEEAKIYKEGSMVLAGSNDATGMLNTKATQFEEPPSTQIKEPTIEEFKVLIKQLLK